MIIRTHSRIFEKGKEFMAMSSQPFEEPLGIPILTRGFEELIESIVQSLFETAISLPRQPILFLRQSDGVLEYAGQFFAKTLPSRRGVELVHFDQFCEEVIETPLLGQSTDLIVGPPEVTNEDAFEEAAQHLFDYGRGSAFGDDIIAEPGSYKAPEPKSDAVSSPARFVG